ncbi:hypothetical protein [Pseudobacteroides cellulosolvens]|uniref:Radical SAM protein n=2 Tax=Pseudobacteroides cellulosolvens TaxID=35825 RepID=A0A0L6JRJ9_9FIRM|nr:hypothetical protein [Pseudobacteroides cellulosolvens]KNY28408.1 radical SAM protein [Pseudobacteroides cellulosolvens ATCC 35603 = DSM 2933]
MRDKYNRNIEYLRVSVTRNCNLNCIYCMPQNDSDKEKQPLNLGCKNFLTPSEYNSIISEMAQLGIKK